MKRRALLPIVAIYVLALIFTGCESSKEPQISPDNLPSETIESVMPYQSDSIKVSPEVVAEPGVPEFNVVLPEGNFPDRGYEAVEEPERYWGEKVYEIRADNGYGELYPFGYSTDDMWLNMKYGICDAQGRVVCEPVLATISLATMGDRDYYIAEKAYGKYNIDIERSIYVFTTDGSEVMEFEGLCTSPEGPGECDGGYTVKVDGLWGFVDYSFEVVIPFEYSSPLYFSDGLTTQTDGVNYWYIDSTGEMILGPYEYLSDFFYTYEEASALSFSNGMASYYVRSDDGYDFKYLLRDGSIVNTDELNEISYSYVISGTDYIYYYNYGIDGDQSVIINANSQFELSRMYVLGALERNGEQFILLYSGDGKQWFIYNADGELVNEGAGSAERIHMNTFIVRSYSGSLSSIYDSSGELLAGYSDARIYATAGGYIISSGEIYLDGFKYGIIDEDLGEIIPFGLHEYRPVDYSYYNFAGKMTMLVSGDVYHHEEYLFYNENFEEIIRFDRKSFIDYEDMRWYVMGN